MNRIAAIFALLAAATLPGAAATIDFVGPLTQVNDGSYYVLPYQVTIDGVYQQVTCFDILDNVNDGDIWQAGILTLPQAAASGFFTGSDVLAGYERAAWLSVQSYSTPDQQVGLQHAIWNIFGSTAETPDSLSYEAAADAAAASNYAGFDFSQFRFIQQAGAVAGSLNTEQAFVFQDGFIDGMTGQSAATPEPGTVSLFGFGALLIAAGAYRRRSSLIRPPFNSPRVPRQTSRSTDNPGSASVS